MRRSDIVSGVLLVLFGLVMIFFVVPIEIDSTGDYGLDPKFFPVMLLWLVIVMALLLVGSRLPVPADPPDAEVPLDAQNWMFIVGASLYLLAGFVAITALGFIPATIVMIAVLMYIMGVRRQWIRLISVSVAAPVLIYEALQRLFTVQLP